MVKLIGCFRALAATTRDGFAGTGAAAGATGAALCPFASGAPDINASTLLESIAGRFVSAILIPLCY
jgi:hypothetical protein